MPLLRSGVPVLGEAVQLRRAFAAGGRTEPGHVLPVEPAAKQGRDGEVYVLPAPDAAGADAGVRGGLPDRLAEVRQRARPGERRCLHPATEAGVHPEEDVGTLPRFFYYFDERGSRYHEPIAPVEQEGDA